MIRRAFWLGAGAAAGIMGYRRVSALGRRFSLTERPKAGPRSSIPGKQRHAVRETIRFARDVREGMDIYQSRHAVRSGNAVPSGDAVPSGNAVPSIDAVPSGNRSAKDSHDRKDGR